MAESPVEKAESSEEGASEPPVVRAQSSDEGASEELETVSAHQTLTLPENFPGSHGSSEHTTLCTAQPLWTCKECYVYQIPPLKNESGHRANDWNVDKWLWSGRLRLMSKGTVLKVLLEDATSGELFATCPVKSQADKAIDPVVDSRRYFVLRIDDGKGHHAFIGMGFRDRDDAYNFNATMQDHWKSIKRQEEAEVIRKEMEEHYANQPMRDLSLKDGEKLSIKVNVPGKGGPKKPRAPGSGAAFGAPSGGGLLAPPPPAGVPSLQKPAAAAASAPAPPKALSATANDDFGDFSAAGTEEEGDDFGDFAAA